MLFCLILALPLQAPPAPPPAKIAVTPVVRLAFQPNADVLGEIVSPRVTDVGAEVDGRVAAVKVDPGEAVAAGAVLAVLDTTRLEIGIRQAGAELELARQQLGELRAGSRVEDVQVAEALLAQAEAAVDQALLERKRVDELARQNIAEIRRLDEALAAEKVARASVHARGAELDRIRNGPRVEAIARAEAEVATRQAMLDALLSDRDKSTLVAPFDAVVAERSVVEGAFLSRGDRLMRLVQLDPVEAILHVPERIAALIRAGDAIDLVLDALPGEVIATRVAAVLPVADPTTRTFGVRAVLDNPERRILPGMAARGTIHLSRQHEALAVPSDALVRTPLGMVVFVSGGGTVRQVAVEVGLSDGELQEVSGELQAGDPVVVRGNERLFPGQPVIVVGGDGH